jgi:hypothetical protein
MLSALLSPIILCMEAPRRMRLKPTIRTHIPGVRELATRNCWGASALTTVMIAKPPAKNWFWLSAGRSPPRIDCTDRTDLLATRTMVGSTTISAAPISQNMSVAIIGNFEAIMHERLIPESWGTIAPALASLPSHTSKWRTDGNSPAIVRAKIMH